MFLKQNKKDLNVWRQLGRLLEVTSLIKTNPLIQRMSVVMMLIVLATSCTEPPPPTLSSDDRKIADSLYRDSINYLKPMMDSLCELNFDKNVQATVDSIMTERLEEIRKQMKRINEK